MSKVFEILLSKSSDVWSIEPDASVFQALERMAEKDIGALPVIEAGRIVGIFSERDYARNVVLKGRSSRETPVRELMRSPVLYVRPEQTIDDCMALMTRKRVRHLPVLKGEELIGIVTIGDVVKQIISEQDHTIEQLENYIRGVG